MDNVSAFMMHHVINKPVGNQNKKNKKRRKTRQNSLKIKENGITKKKNLLVREKPTKALNKINENLLQKKASPKTDNQNKKNTPNASPKNKESFDNKTLVAIKQEAPSPTTKSPSSDKKNDTSVKSTNAGSKSKLLFEKKFHEKRLFEWMINPIGVDDFMT